MEKNCKCEECGTAYHHCTSCGYEFVYDEDVFCSYACFRKHEQKEGINAALDRIIKKLGEDGIEDLANILFPNLPKISDHPLADNQYAYYGGEAPFDDDIVRDVIIEKFKNREMMQSWGLW